jgi:NAD dependent epimerase/dehydratase family enzyme
MSDFLFDSLRVIPEATQKTGFQFKHPDLGQALRELLAKD